MSYTRPAESGCYIYSEEDRSVVFDGTKVLGNEMDIFLYKLNLTHPGEFQERLKHGKMLIEKWQGKNTEDEKEATYEYLEKNIKNVLNEIELLKKTLKLRDTKKL